MPEPLSLTVVICSLNGAAGVDRCLRALRRQVLESPLDVIVVDDGSTDPTSQVAAAHGAQVVRHETNRGLAAARNTGVRAARGDVVAFLDDDCDPATDWAAQLLAAYDGPHVVGAGGVVEPTGADTFLVRYLGRHNPLQPLEADLSVSESWPYRLRLYLLDLWSPAVRSGRRSAHSLVGANMSFRRAALHAAGMFDERFTFGAEELDLCRRVLAAHPGQRLVIEPSAVVRHHFDLSLRDTLRRSRAYGRGSARMDRKWGSARPTLYPFPIAVGAAVVAAAAGGRPRRVATALSLPLLCYPGWWRRDGRERHGLERLLDPYVQLLQEANNNVGLAKGSWDFRHFEPASDAAPAAAEAGAVSVAAMEVAS